MNLKHSIGLGVVLAALALPAWAFQETQIGGGPAAPAKSEAAPAASGQLQPNAMQLSPAEAPKPTEGTEVRIPGLGKLGVLPKMDFGLELLYGANEGNRPAAEPEDQPDTDDLRIRGTMKHNF